MKKVFFGSFIVFFSCSGETEMPAPANLIPTEKMIPLVVDLQILESHFQRTFGRPDYYKESLDSSSNKLFETYGVTQSQFDSSYTYYSHDMKVMYKIYEAALDSLNFSISEPD